jgi:hypothetical protein
VADLAAGAMGSGLKFSDNLHGWHAILEPGRNVATVCFERVTAISTYWAEPGRNAAGKLEIESFFVAGKLGTVRRRSIPTES